MRNILAMVLAGGKGSRLEPLTRDRAKPAVPFGGLYRIIDFPLSNCINSGLRRILVLTQYKAASLDRPAAARGFQALMSYTLGSAGLRDVTELVEDLAAPTGSESFAEGFEIVLAGLVR